MEWEFIAPMVTVVALFLSIAGVLIFRPLTKRLGDLIEITSRNKQAKLSQEQLDRVVQAVQRLTDRIEQLEERQEFAERILTSQSASAARSRLKETTNP